MSWNYRVAKKKLESGKEVFGIIEVYYGKDGSASGWTDFVDPNEWENLEDLKGTIDLMKKAFDKPIFEELLTEEN